MSDVLLIHAPIILYRDKSEIEQFRWHGGDERSYQPFGILYLAACLEKASHSVTIMDVAPEGKTLEDILLEIDMIKPKVIGISSMTTSIPSAVALAQSIKQKYGNSIPVGLGGVHLCCDPTFLERFKMFDFGVVGEGEKTFINIVGRIKKGERISGTFQGEITEDLGDIPFPARHLMNSKIYLREEQLKFEVPAAGIMGSRGCPYHCSFCCIPSIGRRVRIRSAKNVIDEMESIYDTCRGFYSFVDDCFTISKEHTLSFCQEIINRKLDAKWIISTRANTMDEEVAKALARAGCTDVYFGVESGNERVRNEVIKKQVTDKQIARAIAVCKKERILTNLFLMVGFPGETKKEMMDTTRIGNKMGADMIGIHITMPLPGTEIFNYCVKNKIIHEDIIDRYARGEMGRGFRDVWPLFVPEGYTLKDLIDIKKKTYMNFYLSPAWILRRIKTWFLIPNKFKEDIKLFKIALHVFATGGTKGQLS